MLVDESTNKKEYYAIPVEQVKEIRSLDFITRVPNSKSFVKGIMNHRGLIIPVLDLKEMLGFTPSKIEENNFKILVAEVKNSLYGILVNNIGHVIKLDQENIDPTPKQIFDSAKYLKGVAKIDGKLIVLLDIVKFLNSIPISSENEKVFESPISNNLDKNSINIPSHTSKDEGDIPKELLEVLRQDKDKKKSHPFKPDSKPISKNKKTKKHGDFSSKAF